jgi:hypothetical protein
MLVMPTFDPAGYNQFAVTPVIALLSGIIGFFFGRSSRHGGSSR